MCLFSAIKLAYHHSYYRKTMWVKYDFCIFYLDTMTHQYWHLLHVLKAQLPLTRQQHYFISWPSKHLETAVFHLLNDSIHSGNVISLEWRVLNPKVGWKYPQGPNGGVIIESGIEFEQWKDKICPWDYWFQSKLLTPTPTQVYSKCCKFGRSTPTM